MKRIAHAAALQGLETVAWYALWSATVCLMLVPAAWHVGAGPGWLPLWLVGLPLLCLGLLRLAGADPSRHPRPRPVRIAPALLPAPRRHPPRPVRGRADSAHPRSVREPAARGASR